jgi:uncharacterized protein (UPF0333 family)
LGTDVVSFDQNKAKEKMNKQYNAVTKGVNSQILKFTKIRNFHVKIRKKIHNNIIHSLKELLKILEKK